MIFYGKRVLFLGAHPDDIELGCGALIHHITPVSDVLCVTLSDNQQNPLLKNVVEESYRSMSILGFPVSTSSLARSRPGFSRRRARRSWSICLSCEPITSPT